MSTEGVGVFVANPTCFECASNWRPVSSPVDPDSKWFDGHVSWYKCTNCKKDDVSDQYEYCPNCGVKIDW